MKTGTIFIIVCTFVFGMTVQALAFDFPKPVHKIYNGTSEILKSPLVLFDHTTKEMDTSKYKLIGFGKKEENIDKR